MQTAGYIISGKTEKQALEERYFISFIVKKVVLESEESEQNG